jgi:hypothetical protein
VTHSVSRELEQARELITSNPVTPFASLQSYMYDMAKRSSLFEGIATVASRLPWWVSILLAITAYLVLHAMASRPAPYAPQDIGGALNKLAELSRFGLLKQICFFLQYIIPAAFGLGALGSVLKRWRAPTGETSRLELADSDACPDCGSPMKVKTARRGRSAGEQFYGCSRYPACKGTRATAP